MNNGMLRIDLLLSSVLVLAIETQALNTFSADRPKPGSGEPTYGEPKVLTASIYARDSKQLLFTFKRVASRVGSNVKVEREFTYPDGKLAAREVVLYEGDTLVSYRLDEVQIGASGNATIRRSPNEPTGAAIDFTYRRKPGAPKKANTEGLRENTLTADAVGPFLASHWDALQRGEKVKCRYIVVPRTETVGFTFIKDSDAKRGFPNALLVRMEPTSLFLSPLVDPLFFTIEQAPPHRVLQYVGRTTPKIQIGGNWKDLDAVTVFDWP
jgi:hypothetical protein